MPTAFYPVAHEIRRSGQETDPSYSQYSYSMLNYILGKTASQSDTHTSISESHPTSNSTDKPRQQPGQQPQQHQKSTKSVTQTDDELREKLEQISGEGGASGIEYEDGQPNTMKRSVRNNMFRYI